MLKAVMVVNCLLFWSCIRVSVCVLSNTVFKRTQQCAIRLIEFINIIVVSLQINSHQQLWQLADDISVCPVKGTFTLVSHKLTSPSIHFQHCLSYTVSRGGAVSGPGDTLDGVPTHRRTQTCAHSHTSDDLKMLVSLQCMSLDGGRKPEYPEETTEAL